MSTGSCASYYDSLARRFASVDLTQLSLRHNGTKCPLSKKCAPFSFPSINQSIPLCQTDIDLACFDKVVQTLRLDHKRFCEKTKKVKEYKLKWIRAGRIVTNDPPNTVPVQYQFATPLSSKDHISEGPFKTVKSEYLTMSGISLIGNVGGTMGMFSVIGMSEWIMGTVAKMWSIKATRN